MPRYEKDGFDPIETSLPSEGVQLRAEGWREYKARTAAVREADAERTEEAPTFDDGGTLPEGVNEVRNDTGSPEPLVRETNTETPDDPEADTPKRRRSK